MAPSINLQLIICTHGRSAVEVQCQVKLSQITVFKVEIKLKIKVQPILRFVMKIN